MVENIQPCQCQRGITIDTGAIAGYRNVQPPHPPVSTGSAANLVSDFPDVFTNFVQEFGDEGAISDSGAVGLQDANYRANLARLNAQTRQTPPIVGLEDVT